MSETRKLAAILIADVVGYRRLAGTDEDRTLSRLRGLRGDLIDPAIAAHQGRIVNGWARQNFWLTCDKRRLRINSYLPPATCRVTACAGSRRPSFVSAVQH